MIYILITARGIVMKLGTITNYINEKYENIQ